MIGPVPDAAGQLATRAADDVVSLARGGTMAAAGAATAAMGGFVLTLVVARSLGSSGAGLFFEAVALFMICAGITTLGADTGTLRSLSRCRALGTLREIRTTLVVALAPVLVASLLVTIAAWLLAPQLTDLMSHGHGAASTERYLRVLLVFLTFGTLSTVVVQATRGLGGVLPFVAIQNVFLPIARPAAIGLSVAAGWSVLAVPIAWGVLFVPALIGGCVVLHHQYRGQVRLITSSTPPPRPLRTIAGEFWRFSSVRGISATLDIGLVWFNVLLVGALTSTRDAGVYATASRFVLAGTIVLQAMRLAIAPQISGLMSTGQRERAASIYRVATIWVIAASWPLYLAMAVLSPRLLAFFGHDFTVGAQALTILALAMLVSLGTGNVGTVLLMAGKSSWVMANKVAALSVNVALNLLLVPQLGVNGAALAWAAAIAIDNLAALVEVRKGLGLHGYGRGSYVAAAVAVVCFGVWGLFVRTVLDLGNGAIAIYLGGACAVYALVLWRCRRSMFLDEFLKSFTKAGRRGRSVPAPEVA